MELFLFFTFLLGLLSVLWSVRGCISGSGKKKLPPGPVPLPIVGNLFQLGKKPTETLAKLAKTYGPLMTLKLGRLTAIIVSSATTAKDVLQIHDQALSGRPILDAVRALNHHQASMVWLPPSTRWRNLRKLCNTQIFITQRLDAGESLRHQKVRELLAHVGECAQVGRAVDIGQVAFITTLNLLSNTIFSVDLADHDSEIAQEFKVLLRGVLEEAGKPNVSDYFPLFRPLDLLGIKRRSRKNFEKLYKMFDEMIDQRLNIRAADEAGAPASLPSSSPPSPPTIKKNNKDLLHVLLDHFEDNSSEFGRPDIKSLLWDLFAAGTDSTSTTTEWAMAELLNNPDKMEKVQLELKENVGKGKLVEETDVAQRLPYLQAVVKEALRLHPTIPFLIHKAETEVEISGFTVPKDARVMVNAWAIERDPSIWTNPDSFDPERFLGSSPTSGIDFRGRNFELIPFGAGRRICPGMPLALRMVHLMLASLLQTFDWKIEGGMSPKEMDMEEKIGITLQKAVPLRVIPFNRDTPIQIHYESAMGSSPIQPKSSSTAAGSDPKGPIQHSDY